MKRQLKFVAVFMATLLLLSGSMIPTSAVSQSELESQLAALKRQEAEIANRLANAKSDLKASEQRKKDIDAQIENAKKQIDLLDSQVAAKNAEIDAILAKIAEDEKSIEEHKLSIADTREKLGERMRAITKRGTKSTLQILVDADNYIDYLIKVKAAKLIAQQDQAIIQAYEDEMEALAAEQQSLNAKREELEEQKKTLEAAKAESTKKKQELDKLYAAAQSEVRKMQGSVASIDALLAENRKQMEQTEKDIERIILNAKPSGQYNGKMMYWPVPTVRAMSSLWGDRGGVMHRGIDIANGPIPIYGESIVAAADGTVIYANGTDTNGGGFGYYCIIEHGVDANGKTVTTLYAHCSKMLVKKGDRVVGGKTVIAKAGATGNVTGPHLHFEVRLDSKSVNPYPKYVSPNVN